MDAFNAPMKNKKLWMSLIVSLLVIYAVWTLLYHPTQKEKSIPVEVSIVEPGDISPNYDTSGNIVAHNVADIKAQITGILVEMPVVRGQEVAANQLLFQIDPRPFEASLNQAKATLLKDQAIAANNTAHYDRFQKLMSKGFVSKDDFEQTKANKLSADAQVAVDQAAVQSAELQLQYTKITAPFAGRLSDLPYHIGDLISAASTTALTTINQIKPLDAAFSIPSVALPQLLRTPLNNIKVIATPDANKNYHAEGSLYFIDNQVDTTTGSVALKASFNNDNEGLWPGEFVHLHLIFPTIPNSLLVPTIAIQQNQDQKYYLYVVDKKHKAHLVFVTLGPVEGDKTAILTGLKKDDTVVTKGQFEISEGSHVSFEV